MKIIVYLFDYFLEILKYFLVFYSILGLEQRKGIQKYISTASGIVVLAMSDAVLYNTVYEKYLPLLYLATIVIISVIFFKENAIKMIIISVWTIFVICTFDGIVGKIIQFFWNLDGNIIYKELWDILCSIVTIIFILLIVYTYQNKLALIKINLIYYIMFSIIILVNMFALTMFSEIANSEINVYKKIPVIVIYATISLGVLIQLFLILSLAVSKNVYKEKDELNKQYLKAQEKQYLYMESREEKTKKFRHDIKAHINMMQELCRGKKYDELQQYIDVISDRVDTFGNNIHVNNGFAEAILNQYASICEKNNIQYRIEGHFPSDCKIEPFDICTILSNLLMNGVEANNKIASSYAHKEMHLEIRYDSEGKLFVYAYNTYNGKIKYDGNKIITSKENIKSHGYGMENIKECILKYNGTMSIKTENNIFEVKIMLENW